jgi:outer membrane protein OmpA-like peptidoglycan-associated protein
VATHSRPAPQVVLCGLLLVIPAAARAQPAETEIPGVTAELVELYAGEAALRLAVRFVNGSASAVSGTDISFKDIYLVDEKSKQKHFGIKDATGQFVAGPISDWNDGGRWWIELAPKSEAVLWMLFEGAKPGSTFAVHIPRLFPFEEVPARDSPASFFKAEAASSIPAGLRAHLVSARRTGNEVRVRLKLENQGPAYPPTALQYRDAYLFDPVGKRKYSLLKDSDGSYVAQPKSDSDAGGRYWLNTIPAKGTALMSLSFGAPPPTVGRIHVILPQFVPLMDVRLEGNGGPGSEGVAAAGRSLQLEGALKELDAEVTSREIRIRLSADVLFDLDKSTLKPEAESQLQKLAMVVKAKPGARVAIEGHTDVQGEETYNQKLSEARAESVRQWLVNQQIEGSQITTQGFGETRPVRKGTTAVDHQANRRVEIRIVGGG